MADTPEAKVKKQIKKVLARHADQLYVNWPVPNGYGEPMLDCIGCHRGAFFAIEAKAPGEFPRPRQRLSMEMMRAAGAKVFLIDTVRVGVFGDSEDVFNSLDQLDEWLLLH